VITLEIEILRQRKDSGRTVVDAQLAALAMLHVDVDIAKNREGFRQDWGPLYHDASITWMISLTTRTPSGLSANGGLPESGYIYG
jgi:hypothetical protein